MARKGTAGVLMLVCTVTKEAVDTGVRYTASDLTRAAAAKLRMRCPFCRRTHMFSFTDATLRRPKRGENGV
jgi:hypothetical protein